MRQAFFLGKLTQGAQEGSSSMRGRPATALHEPKPALPIKLRNGNANKLAARELLPNGKRGQNRHTRAQRNKAFNRLQTRQLHAHVQRGAHAPEKLGDVAAQRRSDSMPDEVLRAQLTDRDRSGGGERSGRGGGLSGSP